MELTSLTGKKYWIRWYHRGPDLKKGIQGTTILINYSKPNKESDADEYCITKLHPKDRFNKKLGRKYAFAKWVNQFDRNERKNLWNQFLNKNQK